MEELDLVEEEDQFTHMITLDDVTGGEEILNVFKVDPEYEENEEKFKAIKRELLGKLETLSVTQCEKRKSFLNSIKLKKRKKISKFFTL